MHQVLLQLLQSTWAMSQTLIPSLLLLLHLPRNSFIEQHLHLNSKEVVHYHQLQWPLPSITLQDLVLELPMLLLLQLQIKDSRCNYKLAVGPLTLLSRYLPLQVSIHITSFQIHLLKFAFVIQQLWVRYNSLFQVVKYCRSYQVPKHQCLSQLPASKYKQDLWLQFGLSSHNFDLSLPPTALSIQFKLPPQGNVKFE
jgi:hypothetical protein